MPCFKDLAFFNKTYRYRDYLNIKACYLAWNYKMSCELFYNIRVLFQVFGEIFNLNINHRRGFAHHKTVCCLLDDSCRGNTMNFRIFDSEKKFPAGFVESGIFREMIDKDVCVNEYPLVSLYFMKEQCLCLFGEEFRLKGNRINGLAVSCRNNTTCGHCNAFSFFFFNDDLQPLMLFYFNLSKGFKNTVFKNSIYYFRHFHVTPFQSEIVKV